MVPLHFLEELDQGARYVFFDYVLSTGATWKDSIGEETVWLKLDPSWAGARLYMHAMEAGEWRTEEIDRAGLETAVRVFRRTGYSPAPDEVVYFALSHEDR